MRVHIIGAGAVGMLMASYLSKAQLDVVLVAKDAQQAATLRAQPLQLCTLTNEYERIAVKVTAQFQPAAEDVAIVAVKYPHLHTIWQQLTMYPHTPLLFLQNGLAHFDEALALPHAHILFGSAQFGASKLDNWTVAHRGLGPLKLAVGRGAMQHWQPLSSIGSEAFPLELVDDAEQMLLEKALLNCLINPLTAILQVQNGELLTNKQAYELMKRVYTELMAAFPSMRERFSFTLVEQLCERTARNTSSMLADRLAGRPTEANSIVGAVIARAAAPVPTLLMLYELLQAIDQTKEPIACS